VSVRTEDIVKPQDLRRYHPNMEPFEFFFGPDMRRPQKRTGAGSGFFIGEDGLVVTNNHVVDGAEKIWVKLADDTEITAKLVGRDPGYDVALIRVDGKGPFKPLSLGDSDTLRVGEWVMAVGNPLAMAHTVTVGVVSAKGRYLGLSEETSPFENFIQTDAAINLGNSGGPLVNLRGEVVGMNTAINAAGQNLGFALPVNAIKAVVPQLKDRGKVTRGYLGVRITSIDQQQQEAFGLTSREGALVQSVEEDGPAGKGGIKAGDAIVGVNGAPVKDQRQLIDRVSSIPPGKKAEIDVVREGKRRSVAVVVGERPANDSKGESRSEGDEAPAAKLGLAVSDLTARVRRQFELPTGMSGVIVTDVTDLSPADEAGLRSGDVVLRVNDREVASEREFADSISGVRAGALIRLYVYRSALGQKSFVILRMP
jgi:serine protease Do